MAIPCIVLGCLLLLDHRNFFSNLLPLSTFYLYLRIAFFFIKIQVLPMITTLRVTASCQSSAIDYQEREKL